MAKARITINPHNPERLVERNGRFYLYYRADGKTKCERLSRARVAFWRLAKRLDTLHKKDRAVILQLLEVNYCITCGGHHMCGCPDGEERRGRAHRIEGVLDQLAKAAAVTPAARQAMAL